MKFMLGCNYWASNAGVDMWKNFNPKAIEKDLKVLSKHGVRYMRVFPLWREFQPVAPNIGGGGVIREYVMEGGSKPTNPYFLDEKMLDHFSLFLDLCDKYNIKLVVGIITGWMSGGLFIPSALYNKNILEDPTALYFEQLFIKGFVEKFKDREAIYAWDLGNECNCSGGIKNSHSAAAWTALISNAIKAADPSRNVVSGMHGLYLEERWKLQDQAMFTDILTTHPYPFWCKHTTIDETLSYRTTTHATTETKWYADIGGKPCLAEEIGTMGPMVCSNEKAADFLRLNMFSLWANGSLGVMWWCNCDQNLLETYPYTVQMVERELGLMTAQYKPKPVLLEMKKFAEFMEEKEIDLPKAEEQGICLLTKNQDQWGAAYMSYALAKSVGLNLKFSYAMEQELPDSKLYLIPSPTGQTPFPKSTYDALKKKVYEGADVYISAGKVFLEGFEEFVGLKVIDSYASAETKTVKLDGAEIPFYRAFTKKYQVATAKVLAEDETGNPSITVNKYGKGRVFYIDAPIETNLTGMHNAFNGRFEKIYETIFKDYIKALPVSINAKDVVFTIHNDTDCTYFVAINHSDTEKEMGLDLKGKFQIDSVIYGDANNIKPYDAVILKLKKA